MNKKISIAGAGLVGSLLSIYFLKRGYEVEVYEKRPDMRKKTIDSGRSINMALSHRGLRALQEIGMEASILQKSIPMKGRMVHNEKGEVNFQPYGEDGQMIYSVSRTELNKVLLEKAENLGVNFFFEKEISDLDFSNRAESFTIGFTNDQKSKTNILLAADGAFSKVREGLGKKNIVKYSEETLEHGYKELSIPADGGKYVFEKNALHIWPRGQFMLIALPNPDGSFTCTLFLPFKGEVSFSALNSKEELHEFFREFFPDAYAVMPDLVEEYLSHPTSSLNTISCFPWVYEDKLALIGDAAHAIVPFYGQGMNAGFEDCRILNELLNKNKDDWFLSLREYQESRKVNTDAIAKLALRNFEEMRDLVADPQFILRKKIESKIHRKHSSYLPLYSMVTFSDLPYSEILEIEKRQDMMMEEILNIHGIQKSWNTDEGWQLIQLIFNKFF